MQKDWTNKSRAYTMFALEEVHLDAINRRYRRTRAEITR